MSADETMNDLQYPREGGADLVEVVRCKDCKYGSPNKVYGCKLERFSIHDDDPRMYSDDYCSRGERRDE